MIIYSITGFLDGGIHWHFEPTLRKAKNYKRSVEENSEFHDLDIEGCEVIPGKTALVDFLNHLIFHTAMNEH